MSYRVSAAVSGVDRIDFLIEQAENVDAPAQIQREARASVPVIRQLYLNGYSLTRAPIGAKWAERKHAYPHPMLVKRPGAGMRDTTTFTPVADGVVIDVSAEHAQYQHGGTETIDARPIVPEDDLGTWEQPIGLARRAAGPVLP
jgi:hypothetical protein